MRPASSRTCSLILASLLSLASASALAQAWPTKSIRYIVPFPPAGATDILARLVAERLSATLKHPVVVENRPGAAGALGTEFVAKSPPDGHTILMATVAQAISETLYTKQPFSFARDLAPVALVARVPNVMVVHPSLPVKTVKEFIALAKARPDQLCLLRHRHFGAHVGGAFQDAYRVNMVHVPYMGSGPALTGLLSGEASVMFDNLPAAMPHIKTGRLRPIAVTTAKRHEGMPNLPISRNRSRATRRAPGSASWCRLRHRARSSRA